jgi:hypothetical protein
MTVESLAKPFPTWFHVAPWKVHPLLSKHVNIEEFGTLKGTVTARGRGESIWRDSRRIT